MRHRLGQIFLTIALGCIFALSASAITIDIDYSYDSPALGGSNFFGSGNPQGATGGSQARAALEAAASYFSSILNDTFSAITIPPPYHSTAPGSTGVNTWFFEQRFQHPSGTTEVAIPNPTIPDSSVPANTYIVYAGARSLAGNVAGIGAVGGQFHGNEISGTNQFTPSDISAMNQSDANFIDAVETRGEPSGFSRWGGTISFDTDVSPAWHLNHTTTPSGNVRDFFSVAIHELGHALGFGSQSPSDQTPWEALVSGSNFIGANAMSQNGGNPVPLSADRAHWANGTQSVVYGGMTAQEAAMDPDLQNGTRKRFTALDAAAMRDIGWEVIAPPVPTLFGDYNNNGRVDAADYVVWRERLGQNVTIPNDMSPGNVSTGDYTLWRTSFGLTGSGSAAALAGVPEPGAFMLAIAGVSLILGARRRPVASAIGARRG
jgi:hypothetical protein